MTDILSEENGAEKTAAFAFKSEWKSRPYITIGVGLLVSVSFCGYLLKTFE